LLLLLLSWPNFGQHKLPHVRTVNLDNVIRKAYVATVEEMNGGAQAVRTPALKHANMDDVTRILVSVAVVKEMNGGVIPARTHVQKCASMEDAIKEPAIAIDAKTQRLGVNLVWTCARQIAILGNVRRKLASATDAKMINGGAIPV